MTEPSAGLEQEETEHDVDLIHECRHAESLGCHNLWSANPIMGEQQVLAQASLKGDAAHLLEERHIDGDGS